MTQQFHFWVFNPKKWKWTLREISAPYVHCNIIQSSQDVERAPVCPQMNGYKLWCMQMALKWKETLSRAMMWINCKDIMLGKKKPDTKGHILCSFTYIKYPE